MNARSRAWLLLAPLVLALMAGQNAAGAETPTTLWNFLGIPQGINKVKDVTINRRGNHPGLERKDPLKRIADPANLESDNPAIKAAAKIKKEQDLEKQKIKAIKYLSTVGCGCYPGVREALLAALDDCTEEVRLEAAIAFCKAAGSCCDQCAEGCCNAEVMQKLHEMAYGQDEKGCYIESSCEVRAAAAGALNACRQKHPASPMAPEPVPTEAPRKEIPIEAPKAPVEAPQASLRAKPVVEENALARTLAYVKSAAESRPEPNLAERDDVGFAEVSDRAANTPTPNHVRVAANTVVKAASARTRLSLP